MVKFERRDPFPLVEQFGRSEALDHAAACDAWLGLRVVEIERELASRGSARPAPASSGAHQQLWFGLEPRDLQTPYLEIRHLLSGLGEFTSVVDLGAAYARMAFVIERHFTGARFTGFEYVGERVAEARAALQRFGASRSWIEHLDLTAPSFIMPRADVYFVYDYGTPAAIEKTLHDIRRATRDHRAVIVARGRVCRYAIESRHASWLTKPVAPESSVTVYSTNFDGIETSVQNGV